MNQGITLDTVYNEDCRLTMARMPENFIDLTVTSPPYDQLRDYDKECGVEWNFEVFQDVARLLYRVTKVGGVVVWVVADGTVDRGETGTSFRQALYFKDVGFTLHDTMIFKKNGVRYFSKNRYGQVFEYMFVFSKGVPKTFNGIKDVKKKKVKRKIYVTNRLVNGECVQLVKQVKNVSGYRLRSNIWEYNVGWTTSHTDKIAYDHPATFPEQLVADHIRTWSNENDVVYDCFAGSGTTGKMCILLNRRYVLSEVSKKYCEIIEKRLRLCQSQGSLFSGDLESEVICQNM